MVLALDDDYVPPCICKQRDRDEAVVPGTDHYGVGRAASGCHDVILSAAGSAETGRPKRPAARRRGIVVAAADTSGNENFAHVRLASRAHLARGVADRASAAIP